ncbi:MAG TPA: hypothetical protein VMX17_12800 [Candidatus Glassbacteria bacterium]|nr:hypothetical protein [Candidatus Glassbacteria bacterium]
MKESTIFSLSILGAVVSFIVYASFIFGLIYFVFWCLKHFNIIGG